jgi:hypothetical protein
MNIGSSAFISSGLQSLDTVAAMLMIPVIAASLHGHSAARALYDDHGLHVRALLQRLVGIGLERDVLAAAQPFIRRDHEIGRTVEHAVRNAVRREPPNTTECTAPMRVQASIA